MLENLKILNFALIDDLEINFGAGLNVLTGETGAGKSIVLDALNFVLGERADKDQIRTGQKFTFVQAVFNVDKNAKVKLELEALGLASDDATLVLSRRLATDGRGEVRINGNVVNLNMLRAVTARLVDIYGQHEHQSLLKASNHISFIDGLCPKETAQYLFRLSEEIAKLHALKESLSALGGSSEERARKLDLLEFQKNELISANLKAGEFEKLEERLKRMQNTEKVVATANVVLGALDGAGSGAIATVYQSAKQLVAISNVDDSFKALAERLDASRIELADITESLQSSLADYDFSESEFNEIDARIDLLRTLMRKYGGSVESAISELANIAKQIDDIGEGAERIKQLSTQIEQVEAQIVSACNELSVLRNKTAAELEQKLNPELRELGMKNAQFKVGSKALATYTSLGHDDIEFMFSANLGEPLKSLSKVISGGEMSRFMLAFKVVVGASDEIGTLVFDEIDSGISGTIGQVVAEKMGRIARVAQVISVSHLPQIAAMADYHYLISKSTEGGKTSTSVVKLDFAGRVGEVARLSGGKESSAATAEHAKELLSAASAIKEKVA